MEVIAVPPPRGIVGIKWGHQVLSSWLIVRHRTALLSSFKLVAQRPSPLPDVCFFFCPSEGLPSHHHGLLPVFISPSWPLEARISGFRSQDSKSQDSPFQPSYSGFRLEKRTLGFHGDITGGTGGRASVICVQNEWEWGLGPSSNLHPEYGFSTLVFLW